MRAATVGVAPAEENDLTVLATTVCAEASRDGEILHASQAQNRTAAPGFHSIYLGPLGCLNVPITSTTGLRFGTSDIRIRCLSGR
jgi:hypothetical protein